MNKNNLTYILLFLAVALSALSFPDKNGKIVVNENDMIVRLIENTGSDIKTAEALFTVDVSRKKCFELINNIIDYPSFMPDIEKTIFVKNTSEGKLYDFIYDAPLFDIEYTLLLKDTLDEGIYYIEWSYVKGDLNDSNGSWEIKIDPDNGNGTLINYRTYLDTGTILPDWLMNRLTAGSIPDMIEAIRKRVKKIK
ncbi:MAG: hypothetical protein PF638_08355 [Candidatus Delongbacteria bacterium]|jgi:ribosome-associated toxin RatA of RatAB toxin-antitoxin module|nr:hypothetical protein [Candidatus Delongbacteria bacterium]